MKNLIIWNTAAAATCLLFLGCAAPTSRPASLNVPPEQLLHSLGGKTLTARGDPDTIYGLAHFRAHLQPAADRCRADGGEIVILARSPVQFAARVEGSAGGRLAQLLLPSRLVCRTNSTLAWGADVRYTDTTFFPSQWAGEVFYYVVMQFAFLPGALLERTEPSSVSNREAARQESEECASLRRMYAERLRTQPAIGMKVAFGVIVDLRPPLALIQYNAFGQQMKGREQEWVQVSSLSAGSDCPR